MLFHSRDNTQRRLRLAVMLALGASPLTTAWAADDMESGRLEEIVVTAQKREQSVKDVGMAVTALGDDYLRARGVSDVADLMRVEPSFIVSQAQYGTPVYTIRGVGYNERALAASPAVSVYVDEVPFAYPALTKGATLDIQRVEVLKGPQGTLYGQNATGGAINYIAAKPTDTLEAGVEGTYARFGAYNINGYLSGPVSDSLKARLAVDVTGGGAWQESYTRNDEIGEKDQKKLRLLLDWQASDDLHFALNLNTWTDKSDTSVGQLFAIILQNPAVAENVPDLVNFPLAPRRARAADWFPGYAHRNDQEFYQAALRADWRISDAVDFVSLTSFQHYEQDDVVGNDGLALDSNSELQKGKLKSFSQEFRVNGTAVDEKLFWLAGVTYVKDDVEEDITGRLPYTTPAFAFSETPDGTPTGLPNFEEIYFTSDPEVTTKAVFANLEYKFGDHVSAHASARYTESKIDYSGCLSGDDVFTTGLNGAQAQIKALIGGTFIPVAPGECLTFDQNFDPGLVRDKLSENNVSWRVGLDWKPVDDTLVYASISKGYKAGTFPTLPATGAIQLQPVKQESLLAYEIGTKTTLARVVDVDASVFYYNYQHKQLRGRIVDPTGVFGVIDALVSIPKSEVTGAELALRWRPVAGLSLNTAATFLDTNVKRGSTVDVFSGVVTDYKGYPFPATPKWTVAAGAQYEWSISSNMNMFAGADYRWQDDALSVFEDSRLGPPDLNVKSYGLLDLRLGVKSADDKWSAMVFGKNVTNEYYWTTASRIYDTAVRYTGQPATYGVTFSYRY